MKTLSLKTSQPTHRYLPESLNSALFILFFLLNFTFGFGQDCSITSSASDPTDESPIPLDLNFQGPINRDFAEDDFIVPNGTIGNFERLIPEFIKKNNDVEIENFQVQGSAFEILIKGIPEFLADEFGDAVISITQYTEDDIFYLTYSNGVKSLNLVSENSQQTSINGDDLGSPLDIEASLPESNQRLYLTEKNEQQVNIYNNSATAKLNDFKVPNYDSSNDVGPTGIVTDNAGNIFVAIAFTPDGSYDVEYDKVAVYQPGNYNNPIVFPPDNSGIELDRPYRIAVDKMGRVYVADSGGSTPNGRVLVFDENYNHIHTIEGSQDNIGAPGSIVVDDYGYIYIIDYQNDITFNGIFQNPEDLIAEYDKITSTSYSIKVYDSNANFAYVTEFNQGLNLPIDLEVDYCGNILVNNLKMTGDQPGLSGIDINFDFKLKTFTRHDNFTAEVIPEEEGEIEITLNPENDFFPCDPQPECSFSRVYETETELEPTFDCPVENDLDPIFYGENCSVNLPDYEISNPQNFDPEPFLVQTFTENENSVSVTIEVYNGEGGDLVGECDFEVDLFDNQDPVISDCPPDNVEFTIQEGETHPLEDYTGQITVNDNCDTGLSPTQTPAPGTPIDEDREVTLTVTDEAGNISECIFTVVIQVTPPNTPPEAVNNSYMTNQDEVLNIDAPGVLGNDEDEEEDNLTANFEDGAENGTVTFNSDGSFSYEPDPGFVGEDNFTYRAYDGEDSSNLATVTITVNSTDPAAPEIECINHELFLNESGQVTLDPRDIFDGDPVDLELSTDIENFDCSNLGQNTVILTATDPETELSDTCVTEVLVTDNIAPEANCVAPGREFQLQDDSVTISPSAIDLNSADNCDFTRSLSEDTFTTPGTKNIILYIEDSAGNISECPTSIEILAEDEELSEPNYTCPSGTEIPNLSPGENCEIDIPDYSYLIETENFTPRFEQTSERLTEETLYVTIEIINDENGEVLGTCPFSVSIIDSEAPVANCVSGYVVNLDENGTASITPEDLNDNSIDNCGIASMALNQTDFTTADIGEVMITLTVRDDAGNMDSCETMVEVVGAVSGEFQCRENIVVYLDENGEASLNQEDLYTGNANGISISLEPNQLDFNCSDIGTLQIQLDYSGEENGNCIINVDVRDELPPQINTNLIELTLNPEGYAYLEESDVLAEDNCSETLIYEFSKSVFTCKDVGLNTLSVEVKDANGNTAQENIEVQINGQSCAIPEGEDIEFLFLYPNPSDGIFTIATPEGMLIESVRVFDARGRYIMQQDYDTNALFYRMIIQGVAESVYTLQIFTNEGIIVKRAIIKP